jgi:hypothetical protein
MSPLTWYCLSVCRDQIIWFNRLDNLNFRNLEHPSSPTLLQYSVDYHHDVVAQGDGLQVEEGSKPDHVVKLVRSQVADKSAEFSALFRVTIQTPGSN